MSRTLHGRPALRSAALAAAAVLLGLSVGVVDAAGPGTTTPLWTTSAYDPCVGGGSSYGSSSIEFSIHATRNRGQVTLVGAIPSTTYSIREAWTVGTSCNTGPIGSLVTDSQGNGSLRFRWYLPANATGFNFLVESATDTLATVELTR